jgi:hypothetical protein
LVSRPSGDCGGEGTNAVAPARVTTSAALVHTPPVLTAKDAAAAAAIKAASEAVVTAKVERFAELIGKLVNEGLYIAVTVVLHARCSLPFSLPAPSQPAAHCSEDAHVCLRGGRCMNARW